MKKIFTLVLALYSLSAWAHDFVMDGIYYNILEGNNVEVTYAGSSYNSYYDEYSGSVIIPASVTYNGTTYCVTSIGDNAFTGCSSLTSITIPNSVTSIGHFAFYECTSLTSITIPNSVTSIGYYAFSVYPALTSIVVETGNTTYDSRENCNAIIETATNTLIRGCQNTTIPNSVTSIGDEAFRSCSSLTSVTIPNSVTSIGNGAFMGCSSLTSSTIPNSVTSIGGGAFFGCSSLTSITIPNSVTSISNSAFSGCSSLTSLTIPNSVTSIGNFAFDDCRYLASVTIGNRVTSIGNGAFENCSSLKTVICEAIEVPGLEGNVFSYMPHSEAILYVPAQSLDDYKAADQWKKFGTILPLTDAPTDIENISYESQDRFPSPATTCQKLLRNGQLVIIRDGKEYNAMGVEM